MGKRRVQEAAPYKRSRSRSQTGPREGHTPGWLLSAFGRFTFSPSPTTCPERFQFFVGEPLGAPAGEDADREGALIRPLRGTSPLGERKARAGCPVCRPYRPHPPRFARHLPLKGKACGRLIAAPTADTEAVPHFVGNGPKPTRRSQTSRHLLGQARRGCGIASAAILGKLGPSGPSGI